LPTPRQKSFAVDPDMAQLERSQNSAQEAVLAGARRPLEQQRKSPRSAGCGAWAVFFVSAFQLFLKPPQCWRGADRAEVGEEGVELVCAGWPRFAEPKRRTRTLGECQMSRLRECRGLAPFPAFSLHLNFCLRFLRLNLEQISFLRRRQSKPHGRQKSLVPRNVLVPSCLHISAGADEKGRSTHI